MRTNLRALFRSLLSIITEKRYINYYDVQSMNVCQLLVRVYAVRRFPRQKETMRMDVQNTEY